MQITVMTSNSCGKVPLTAVNPCKEIRFGPMNIIDWLRQEGVEGIDFELVTSELHTINIRIHNRALLTMCLLKYTNLQR